jgi:hypothetical protein
MHILFDKHSSKRRKTPDIRKRLDLEPEIFREKYKNNRTSCREDGKQLPFQRKEAVFWQGEVVMLLTNLRKCGRI